MIDFGSIAGMLVIILGLLVSVALHEVGHMLPAKAFGAGVPEFAVGFGSSLWARKFGQTTYHFRLILLGGYVRILGMLRPTPSGVDSADPHALAAAAEGKPTSLSAQARQESAREILSHPQLAPMYALPWWKKLVIMFSGPLINLIIAVILTVTAFSLIGVRAPSTTIESVADCSQASVCSASVAGLQSGDQITAIAGKAVSSWDAVVETIQAVPVGQAVNVQFLRQNETQRVQVQTGDLGGVSAIGIRPRFSRQHFTAGESLSLLGKQAQDSVHLLVRLPQSVWIRTTQIFGQNLDDRQVPLSVVGVVQMGSAIGSAQGAVLTTADRIAGYLNVLAALNLALFIFNLLPLLPLDGGHILAALYEGIRNGYRRLRKLPNRGAVDVARLVPLSYIVVAVFLAMTVILVVADFVSPLV